MSYSPLSQGYDKPISLDRKELSPKTKYLESCNGWKLHLTDPTLIESTFITSHTLRNSNNEIDPLGIWYFCHLEHSKGSGQVTLLEKHVYIDRPSFWKNKIQ